MTASGDKPKIRLVPKTRVFVIFWAKSDPNIGLMRSRAVSQEKSVKRGVAPTASHDAKVQLCLIAP